MTLDGRLQPCKPQRAFMLRQLHAHAFQLIASLHIEKVNVIFFPAVKTMSNKAFFLKPASLKGAVCVLNYSFSWPVRYKERSCEIRRFSI